KTEDEVKETSEYQQLDAAYNSAKDNTSERVKEIDQNVRKIQAKLDAVTDPFQNQRGRIVVISFKLQTATNKFWQNRYAKQLSDKKQEQVTVELPDDSGKKARQKLNYGQLEEMFN